MIKFSNGHELTFANGSGALAFNGKGWWWEQPFRWLGILDPKDFTVVAKTVTLEPRKGNLSLWHPWTCVSTLRKNNLNGATNAVGLTNPGIRSWIDNDYHVAKKNGYNLVASIWPEDEMQANTMTWLLADLDLCYIEINVSCPNTEHEPDHSSVWKICEAVSRECKTPIVLKLAQKQITPEVISNTHDCVEAYHAINTIPWDDIFPNEKSPIQHYSHKLKGGVSGQLIHNEAIDSVIKLRSLTDRPIIGGGGIYSLKDVSNFKQAGANAFSIGTLFMTKPWMPNKIVKAYKE